MDPARRLPFDFDPPRRSDAPPLQPEEFAKILKLRPPAERSIRPRIPPPLTAHDIGAALDVVREAAASIRDADERMRASEARTDALLRRAAEEMKAAEARAQAAEARAEAAETRATEAQARAEEAENWLRQIFATISEELPHRG